MNFPGGNLAFTYGADSKPLSVKYNGSTYYYVTNLQGDVVAILDSSGTMVVEYTYDAWGKLLTTTGTMANTLGLHNPLRYRGYVYDRETELYYLQSRYYNPEWGRFISADGLVSTGQGLIGNNMYAYCLNNPISHKDDTGTSAILATLGIMAIGGLIGSAISAVSSAATQLAINGEVNWKSVGVAAASGFASGAIAASPIGLPGQIIAGGIIGGASYVADCYVNNDDITLDGALLAVGMGTASGLIGGQGANKGNVLSDTFTSFRKTLAREGRRANQAYAQKAIASKASYVTSVFSTTLWESSARFAAGCGISNGVTTGYGNHRLFDNWPSWKLWG